MQPCSKFELLRLIAVYSHVLLKDKELRLLVSFRHISLPTSWFARAHWSFLQHVSSKTFQWENIQAFSSQTSSQVETRCKYLCLLFGCQGACGVANVLLSCAASKLHNIFQVKYDDLMANPSLSSTRRLIISQRGCFSSYFLLLKFWKRCAVRWEANNII